MNGPNRRSLASRVYRMAVRPCMRRLTWPFLILGPLLASATLFAAGPLLPEQLSQLVTLAGLLIMAGAIGFLGLLGGITRLVVRPAAQEAAAQAVEKHVALGPAAHPGLLARDEWDRNHREVVGGLNKIDGSLRELMGKMDCAK